MLVCSECGAVFEEGSAASVREYAGFAGEEGAYYDSAVCPGCRRDSAVEGARCSKCGEWFPESEVEYGLCENCRKKSVEEFEEVMSCSFSPSEREYLQDLLESCRINLL